MDTNSKNDVYSLRKRLKQLRISKDWSQGELAVKLGLDTQKVSKFERGLKKPPLEIFPKLAELFEVSLDYLITGKNYIEEKSVNNPALINRFQEIDQLPKSKQTHLIALMDAFIKQHKFEVLVKEPT